MEQKRIENDAPAKGGETPKPSNAMKAKGSSASPHKASASNGQGVVRRVGRLKTPSDVAKFMAKCIKRAARNDDPGIQYNLVNMSSQLLKALEQVELEKRIAALEERVKHEKAH